MAATTATDEARVRVARPLVLRVAQQAQVGAERQAAHLLVARARPLDLHGLRQRDLKALLAGR